MPMSFSCFYCNTVTDLDVYFEAKTFACPSCNRVYIQNEGEYKFRDKFNDVYDHQGLELGKTAIIKGKEYKLGGILRKKAFGSFYWMEYILHNKALEFVFLSEAGGHWILLQQIEEEYKVDNHPDYITHDGKTFDLYDYSTAEIINALGYFDFDVSKTKVQTVEYINPPFMISVEKTDGEQAVFFGEHISKGAIRKAFKISNLPYRNGIGLVQPFIFNLKNMAFSFCAIAILILISNWQLNKDRVEKEILNTTIPFERFTNKDFVTPTFELNGSAAPLSISVSSNVDNSWANLQIALVNEKTGEEIYANKDVEYYHGYTDGENWTEGSTSEDFNLCGVSEGKYHLALTPMKAPEDATNTEIYVKASWNKPSGRNVWLIFIFMAVFMVAMYFLNRYFETKRWEDSSYSPYSE
jgi:hypothetical protein